MKYYHYLLFSFLIFAVSCQSYKEFTYLQPEKGETDSIFNAKLVDYKIQSADILYIRISTLDEKVNSMINKESGSSMSSMGGGSGAGSMYFTQYSVDKEGFIVMPIVGKVHIAGLNVYEAKDQIGVLVKSYIKEATTDVKLASFKVSTLGEISTKGQITIANDKANIFEVLALAGDITYNGNRRNISIIRLENNQTKIIKIDLTSRKILTSEQYYLRPNDVIYVEPYRSTVFRLRVADYSMFLTLITSTITAALLIINVSK